MSRKNNKAKRVNKKNQKKHTLQKNKGVNELNPSDVVSEVIGANSKTNEETIVKMVSVIAERHSGPIPHPKILSQYKDVMNDAPERIFSMAEKQQDHRISLESAVIRGDVKRADMGLLFGFLLFFGFGAGSVFLLAIGKGIEGYVTLCVSLVGGIGNFIRVGRERAKALEDPKKQRQKKK